jgi:hypothetical protein
LKHKNNAFPKILSPKRHFHEIPFYSTANNKRIKNRKRESQKYMQHIFKLVENKKSDGSMRSGYRI